MNPPYCRKYDIGRPGVIFAHDYVLSYITVPVQNAGIQEQKDTNEYHPD